MNLFREVCPLFFILFFIINSQIAAAQNSSSEKVSIGQKTAPVAQINRSVAPLPSFPAAAAEPAADIERDRDEAKLPEAFQNAKIKRFSDVLRESRAAARFDFRSDEVKSLNNHAEKKRALPVQSADDPGDLKTPARPEGFNWRGAFTQTFMFLGVQHGYALVFQKKTRQALKGKFWSDYGNSVKSLSGWSDGNRFFTNYIAHPMQGALTGFIYVQNSPQARREEFGKSGAYWRSRLKAMLWTTAWSTQFEIGPVSQASIGNVGLKGKQTWVDMVITPTVGSGLMIAEDALDRYLIKSIERRTDNFYIKIFSRMLLNPVRIFANILRFKEPWYRDRPTAR